MPATAHNSPISRPTADGYVRMRSRVLRGATTAPTDLFVDTAAGKLSILCRSGDKLPGGIDSRVGLEVLLRENELGMFAERMFDTTDEWLVDDTASQGERFALLQAAAMSGLEHAWALHQPGPFIDVASRFGEAIVALLDAGVIQPIELFNAASHSHQIGAHSTNVCCYAVLLGGILGWSDQQLGEIAVGAMLHDLGRRSHPPRHYQQRDSIKGDERFEDQSHPQLGFEEMTRHGGFTKEQRLMAYQHHEHLDGSGFPVAITDREIHPWSKLLAVVNTFDGLTSDRGNRARMSIRQAHTRLKAAAGTQLDKEMVACWTQIMNPA